MFDGWRDEEHTTVAYHDNLSDKATKKQHHNIRLARIIPIETMRGLNYLLVSRARSRGASPHPAIRLP